MDLPKGFKEGWSGHPEGEQLPGAAQLGACCRVKPVERTLQGRLGPSGPKEKCFFGHQIIFDRTCPVGA